MPDKVKYTSQYIDNMSFDESLGVSMVEVINADGSLQGGPIKIVIDDTTTTNVTYIGKAATGTATSAAAWQIRRIDQTSGAEILYADGDVNFDNVWDDRATTVVYS